MSSQILHLVNKPLNTFNEAFPGETTSNLIHDTSAPSRFLGQVGARIEFREDNVPFDASVGTLHGGVYQLVKTKAGSTAAPAVGVAAYWDAASAFTDFVVTPDVAVGMQAGVYISAPTKGNYCFIQVLGLATVLTAASVTKTTPAIGDTGVLIAGGRVDVLADATAVTSGNLNDWFGIFEEPAGDGTLNLFQLLGVNQRF